jgi:four helix bundle protein
MGNIKTHKDLKVYQSAFEIALRIYDLSKLFPAEERYSLTDQIRRSSRSVCANLAEAFRKRRYEKLFISKLSDAEAEAAETQVWLDFCISHNYIKQEDYELLYNQLEHILSQIVTMINSPEKWCFLK